MSDVTITQIDWDVLRFEDRKAAVRHEWHSFRRTGSITYWNLGRGLRSVKNQMQHGEWLPFLAEIDMPERTAQRAMQIADEYVSVSDLPAGVSIAIKAIAQPKAAPKPQPAPARPEPSAEPDPEPVEPEVLTEQEAEAAAEQAAAEAEAERDPEAEREAREERLAHRLEGTDGDAVDVLSDKLDRAEAEREEMREERNEANRSAAANRRENVDIRDAMLLIPRSDDAAVLNAAIDDVLAQFFGVARPTTGE